MKKIVVLLVLAGLAGGGYWFYLRPKQVPNIALKDGSGQPVTLDAMRGQKDYLLVVFVVPNCPLSKFSVGMLKEHAAPWSNRVAIAGLLFGTQQQAEAYRSENVLTFPVYGLRSAPDPFAVNDLIKTVGTSVALQDAVFGGTLLLIDHRLKLRVKLEKEDTRKLPEKLNALL